MKRLRITIRTTISLLYYPEDFENASVTWEEFVEWAKKLENATELMCDYLLDDPRDVCEDIVERILKGKLGVRVDCD